MNAKQPYRRPTGHAPGRRPDFTVNMLCKDTDPLVKGRIGAAWLGDNGRITIKLDPFVIIDVFRMNPAITLFPNYRDEEDESAPSNGSRETPY